MQKLQVEIISEDVKQPIVQNKALDALEKITDRGILATIIPDPVTWQKEMRQVY